MRDRKKVDLTAGKDKTKQALKRGPLKRSQLTMGPLRYFTARERNQILRQMISEKIIREEITKSGSPGPVARDYFLIETD
jgi:hypothetical protein